MTENLSPDTAVVKKPRRINGLIVFALVALGIAAFNYRPTVPAVYCTSETLSLKPDIIMLATWWCPYCYQARRYFHNNNISYCEYDIERSDEGKRIYEEKNGRGIPVLLIGDHQLEGFNESSVENLLSKLHRS